jgi:uncharacterized protein (TIGR04255 family)
MTAKMVAKAKRPLDKAASKPLRHPPLSQVAFEVNFPNSFAVETGIAAYQQRAESLYPKSSAEYILRLPATVAFGKPTKQVSTELTPMRSFVFQNSKGSRIVRVSVVNFTLLVTDYLHFEDYVSSLTAAFAPAIEIFQLHDIERIGLRYVNQIPIPSKDAEVQYKKYVRSPLSAEAFSGHVASNFLTEIALDLDSTRKLTIRSGLLPLQAGEPTRTYLLDFDCYSLGGSAPLLGENLASLLEQYHEAIETEFTRAVTDKYWKYMAEGTPL